MDDVFGQPINSILGASMLLSARPTEVEHFCARVIGGQIQLCSIVPDGKISVRWFGSNTTAAAAWAVTENSAGKNVYWTVNVVPEGLNRKPAKADIVVARFVHVDIDPPKNGAEWHSGVVFSHLMALDPSCIVSSGNGLQAFWKLEIPNEDLVAVELLNKSVAEMTGADSSWSIDHLMRVPGTVNYPNRKKTSIGRKPAMASLISVFQ